MSRTAGSVAIAAQASLDDGNLDFTVLSAMELDEDVVRYTIQLPLTTAYTWFCGAPAYPVYIGSRLTKFGRGLSCALSAIDGCSPSFSDEHATIVQLDLEPQAQGGPIFGLRRQTHGLSREVCLTIQTTILQHRTPLRRLLEVARRVI